MAKSQAYCATANFFQIFADGGARGNPGPAAAGAILLNPQNQLIAKAQQFLGTATNNQAEYGGVLLGLALAQKNLARQIKISLDSKLVVEQLKGNWRIKDSQLKKLAAKIQLKIAQFENVQLQHIPRSKNWLADQLVNQALDAKLKLASWII